MVTVWEKGKMTA